MEVAAGAPRSRLLLFVLAATATLAPEATGERRRGGAGGGCGARRPGPASGSLLLFLKHGAGPGAQVAAPGRRPDFKCLAAATRAAGGRPRRGEGVGSSAGGRARQPAAARAADSEGGSVGRSRPGLGAALWEASGRRPRAPGCEALLDLESWGCPRVPASRCVALSRAPHPELLGASGSGGPGGVGGGGGFQGGV